MASAIGLCEPPLDTHKICLALNGSSACLRHLRSAGIQLLLVLSLLPAAALCQVPVLNVDCTGATTGDYKSIQAAVNAVTSPLGAVIFVKGPCNEGVTVASNKPNVEIVGANSTVQTLTGNLLIDGATGAYISYLSVTDPVPGEGEGIIVAQGGSVELVRVAANNSTGDGLVVEDGSLVDIWGSSFNSNSWFGIRVSDQSLVRIYWDTPSTTVNSNSLGGILLDHSTLETSSYVPLTISDSGVGTSGNPVYGITLLQGSTANLAANATIQGNLTGGIDLQENSQLWITGGTTITSNGSVGIAASTGSEVSLSSTVQISQHRGPGVDISSNSRLWSADATFSGNGIVTDPTSGGVRVSGDSHAFIQGGQFTNNIGAGIVAQLLSSVDFKQAAFSGNSGGIILCDNTSFMWTDPITAEQKRQIACATPGLPPPINVAKPLTLRLPMPAAPIRHARPAGGLLNPITK